MSMTMQRALPRADWTGSAGGARGEKRKSPPPSGLIGQIVRIEDSSVFSYHNLNGLGGATANPIKRLAPQPRIELHLRRCPTPPGRYPPAVFAIQPRSETIRRPGRARRCVKSRRAPTSSAPVKRLWPSNPAPKQWLSANGTKPVLEFDRAVRDQLVRQRRTAMSLVGFLMILRECKAQQIGAGTAMIVLVCE